MSQDDDISDSEGTEEAGGALTGIMGDVFSDLDGISLPPPVKKSLWKSFGRLVLGVTDIGVATLEVKAKNIRTEGAAKDVVTMGAAKAAADQFGQDAELRERAVQYFGSRVMGEQANRESIFGKAVEWLKQKTSSITTTEEIEGDWLYRFARHAEGVSNEKMQQVWARVLAQEIVTPGSFSLRALTILSEMGKEDARAFQRACLCSFQMGDEAGLLYIANSTFVGNRDLNDRFRKIVNQDDWDLLKSVGIVYPKSFSTRLDVPGENDDEMVITVSGVSFKLWLSRQRSSVINAGHFIQFTPVGNELRKLIDVSPQEDLVQVYKDAWEREDVLFAERP